MATGRVNVGGGGIGLNIFTQLSEPATKEGLWLKTSKRYKKTISDYIAWIANTFRDETLIADMPTPRFNVHTVYCNGAIYAIGGQQSTLTATYGKCYRYDIGTNTWTEIASPQHLIISGFSVVVVDKKIYVIAGKTSSTTLGLIQIYDTVTNMWSLTTNMQLQTTGYTSMYGHSSVYLNGKIYCFDGRDSGNNGITNLFAYDIGTNTWSIIYSAMGTGRYQEAPAFYVGGYIYHFYNKLSAVVTSVRRVNLDTGVIEALPDAPFLYNDSDAVQVNGKIYLCSTTNMYEFDTSNLTFSLVSTLPTELNGKNGKRMAYFNGLIYFMGSGFLAATQSSLTTSFTFVPKVYENGTLIIIRTDNFYGKYKTCFSSPFGLSGGYDRLLSTFDDAFLYSDDDLYSLESYYGDGTKWVKYKEAIS